MAEANRDITALGGTAVLMLVITAVTGYLWLIGKRGAMWLVLAATLGGWLLSSLLKYFFAGHTPMSYRIWPMSTTPASPADIR